MRVAAGSWLQLLLRVPLLAGAQRSRMTVECAEFDSGDLGLNEAWLVTHSDLVLGGARVSVWSNAARIRRRSLSWALLRMWVSRRAVAVYRVRVDGDLDAVGTARLAELSWWSGDEMMVVVAQRRSNGLGLRQVWLQLLGQQPSDRRTTTESTRFHRWSPLGRAPSIGSTPSDRWSDNRDLLLEAQRHRTVDVVIPVHDALEAVSTCLRSVDEHRDAGRHRIIIVDDGSSPPTAGWLDSFAAAHENCVLVRHGDALGFSAAVNAGLRASNAEMVVVLNSDTEVVGDWIVKLADWLFRPRGVGIVGPLSNAASHQSLPRVAPNEAERAAGQTVFNDLPVGLSLDAVNHRLEHHANRRPLRTSMVHGFCFALRREVVEQVGLLDEVNFPRGYGEEFDYCFRIANAGWSAVIATNTYVWHAKTQSYSADERARLGPVGIATVERLHGAGRKAMASRILSRSPELERLRQLFER